MVGKLDHTDKMSTHHVHIVVRVEVVSPGDKRVTVD